MHIPLTPEANLNILLVFPNAKTFRVEEIYHVLDQLLSLDVGHAVNTGNTVTVKLN